MARLWGDGFDHYGNDESNMLDNAYANAQCELSTAHPATGTHGVFFGTPADTQLGLRKVLPASKTKLGASGRFYFPSLPTQNDAACIFFMNTAEVNRAQLAFFVDANGCIRVYRNYYNDSLFKNAGTLLVTTDPLVGAAAQNHIEVQANISDTLGWIRVAINGVHRYASATNLDTQHNADGVVSISNGQTYFAGGSHPGDFYMDDLSYYDFTGNSAVDTDWCPTTDGSGVATNYIGELQAMLQLADGDTSEADWAKSTGTTGYPLIGKATPDDSTYIYSAAAADLSEFTLTNLPVEITYIRGLDFHSRMSKSDAGAALYKVGMKSVAATSDATEIPITVEPAYWYAQINVDPNSSARWTRASLNAAWLRQIRSA